MLISRFLEQVLRTIALKIKLYIYQNGQCRIFMPKIHPLFDWMYGALNTVIGNNYGF